VLQYLIAADSQFFSSTEQIPADPPMGGENRTSQKCRLRTLIKYRNSSAFLVTIRSCDQNEILGFSSFPAPAASRLRPHQLIASANVAMMSGLMLHLIGKPDPAGSAGMLEYADRNCSGRSGFRDEFG